MLRSGLASLGLLLGSAASALAASPTVTIASGAVIGTTTTLPSATVGVNKYLGVPFAKSPPERFSPPEDPAPWSSPIDATALKPACIQQFSYPAQSRERTIALFNNPGGPPPPESEDCLYLNVFTPSSPAPAGGRSVLFWIYGGGLNFGDAGLPTYDGSSFAANQDVVLVTTNYRTNVFGFSNSPQIATGQQNSGLLDQRKALDWVQKNIKAFGGNPDSVLIFGESAGGYSVKQLIATPPKPLNFHSAILESQGSNTDTSGLASWETLVANVSCTTAPSQIDCVRSVNASTIKNIIEQQALAFPPVFDNVTAVRDVTVPFKAGTAAKVPFLAGTNSQEGRVFAYIAGLDNSSIPVEVYLNATFPGQPALQQAILNAYPNDPNSYHVISQIITDSTFLCPTVNLGKLALDSGYTAYRYFYNASFPNLQTFPDAGVYHSSEIPQVFGTYPPFNVTAQQIGLSKYMQTHWANFAKNPSGGPGWPRLGSNGGVELGDLGGNGISGEETIPLSTVDSICAVYAPLYVGIGP